MEKDYHIACGRDPVRCHSRQTGVHSRPSHRLWRVRQTLGVLRRTNGAGEKYPLNLIWIMPAKGSSKILRVRANAAHMFVLLAGSPIFTVTKEYT
jgi:hypothetical protein